MYGKGKMRPYECGIDPTTDAHSRFTVRYYIVAMLFLIFDVETIFLLPWAIIFMGNDFSFTKFALVEMFVFIAQGRRKIVSTSKIKNNMATM